MKPEKAVKLAIENVLKEGLTDIFPRPFEIDLLKNSKFQKKLIQNIVKSIRGGTLESLEVKPIEHVLLPKGGPFDFRRCALIDPLDTIKFLSLVLIFADEIEKSRPKKSRKIVFSYRFKPSNGFLFDNKYNISAFRKHVSEKIKQKKIRILVKCDIANFYDRLNLHRLESILLSLNLDKKLVRLLNELLLFWANRDSYSLPVGSNASRILAETALIEVDNYLLSIGAKFCRFVDDFRFFAPNAHIAHYWLTQLIERLWLEGLTINQRKTKIEDVSEIVQDAAEESIDRDVKNIKTKNKKEPVKIIAGYGGVIPTKLREFSESEIEKFKNKSPDEIYKKIRSKKLAEPEDIKEFIKATISRKRYDYFTKFPELSELFPQFTPYLVDILVKYGEKMPKNKRELIRDAFASKLKDNQRLPEYLVIAIVRLLGNDFFRDKDTLLQVFRGLRRNAGAYVGRALLEALENQVSRNEVLEIRQYFSHADSWEKRQIIKIVDVHLSKDEKRPWLKNVRIQESKDLFLSEYIKPSK